MTIGFKIIREMTKDELVEEVLSHQRRALEDLDLSLLRSHVVDYRVADTRKRLESEAEIVIHETPFGRHIRSEECDE